MKLQVKFKENAPVSERDGVIGALSERGASAVRPLFPEARDPELGSLYVVELNGGDRQRLLGYLKKAKAVEFAEPEVRRKLIR